MGRGSRPLEPAALRDELELGESKLMTALTRLEDAGAVEIRPDGRVRLLGSDRDKVERAMESADERRAFDRSRLEMMRAYAEHEHCRRMFVLSYFGEPYEYACGNCDNCEPVHGRPDASGEPFPVGARVRHGGDGMVLLFDSVGYKTLSVELVGERDPAQPVHVRRSRAPCRATKR